MTSALLMLALQVRVLSLAEAEEKAAANQPQLRQARATRQAVQARSDQARAELLPQLGGTASYQRTTANFVARPGVVPNNLMGMMTAPSFDTFNFWNFGATLSQQIFDFGGSINRFRAAQAAGEAQDEATRTTLLQVIYNVRAAYFTARAQRALVEVAREALGNQERHLQQAQGFARVGTRPEIDVAQARTDRANARVQLISADNAYQVAKLQLNQAMGVEAPVDYEVRDEALPQVPGEEAAEPLYEQALRDRSELSQIEQQLRGQRLTIWGARAAYSPGLSASTSMTAAGTDLSRLTWNWNVTLSLSWAIFDGLLARAQVAEADAALAGLQAQRDALRLQVRVDVEQARLQVRGAVAALGAAGEAQSAAQDRLRLAERRYETGLGSIIELSDAQVAATQAAGQRVQADYNLATARALLLRALGRR